MTCLIVKDMVNLNYERLKIMMDLNYSIIVIIRAIGVLVPLLLLLELIHTRCPGLIMTK